MPLYEYICQQCDHAFEELIRADETPSCTQCGGTRVSRLISAPFAHTANSSSGPCRSMESLPTCGRGGCGLPQCES